MYALINQQTYLIIKKKIWAMWYMGEIWENMPPFIKTHTNALAFYNELS